MDSLRFWTLKNIIMNYKFPDFNVEIVKPTITVVNVSDKIQLKYCVVSILLVDEVGTNFGFTFPDLFTYVDTWEDSEINAWVSKELVQYEDVTQLKK
jgi:hypothetical protein